MSCTDCHSPHKGSIYRGGGTALLSENESCFRCHAKQRGPYVFEARNQGKAAPFVTRLMARSTPSCSRFVIPICDLMVTSRIEWAVKFSIGGSDHTLRVQEGTCWTAGCHEAVHGSRVSSSLRF